MWGSNDKNAIINKNIKNNSKNIIKREIDYQVKFDNFILNKHSFFYNTHNILVSMPLSDKVLDGSSIFLHKFIKILLNININIRIYVYTFYDIASSFFNKYICHDERVIYISNLEFNTLSNKDKIIKITKKYNINTLFLRSVNINYSELDDDVLKKTWIYVLNVNTNIPNNICGLVCQTNKISNYYQNIHNKIILYPTININSNNNYEFNKKNIKVSYCGTIRKEFCSFELLTFFDYLSKYRNDEYTFDITLIIAKSIDYNNNNEIINNLKQRQNVKIYKELTYNESLDIIKNSDIGFAFKETNNITNSTQISSKFLDYISNNRYIIINDGMELENELFTNYPFITNNLEPKNIMSLVLEIIDNLNKNIFINKYINSELLNRFTSKYQTTIIKNSLFNTLTSYTRQIYITDNNIKIQTSRTTFNKNNFNNKLFLSSRYIVCLFNKNYYYNDLFFDDIEYKLRRNFSMIKKNVIPMCELNINNYNNKTFIIDLYSHDSINIGVYIIDEIYLFKDVFSYDNHMNIDLIEYKKKSKAKYPIIMCQWKRPELLEQILVSLNNQTILDFDLFIWNNNIQISKILENIIKKSQIKFNIYLHNHKTNIGGIARFILAKHLLNINNYEYILFIDDDQFWKPLVFEKLINLATKKHSFHFYGRIFSNSHNYTNSWNNLYSPKNIIDSNKLDYGGTGTMIIDSNIFMDDALFYFNKKYIFIEDLWLSYFSKKFHNYTIIDAKISSDIQFTNDDKALYDTIKNLKNEFLNILKKDGKWLL